MMEIKQEYAKDSATRMEDTEQEGDRLSDGEEASPRPTDARRPMTVQRGLHRLNVLVDNARTIRPQRFRKPNYTEVEKRLIFSLLLPRLQVVENKSLDRRVLKDKYEMWKEVTARYNAAIAASGNTLVTRNIEDLRTFWKNARRKNQWREHLVTVPDLVERVTGSGNKSDDGGGDDQDDQDQDDDHHGPPPPEVTMMDDEPHHLDSDLRNSKGKAFHPHHRPQSQHSDVGDDHMSGDQRQSPSPTHGNTTGLVGPYLLKKETHCSTVLDQLMRDDTYTDVTLTAEGQSLRAHRIVLCLASSYFRQVLSREMSVQSVIVLRDIKFAELRNIVHFIYTGEATVDASELESFMRTAEMLEISSLCEGQKCIASRGTPLQSNYTSSFSVGDFERLVGTKRSRKDTSPTSSKARRPSGEGPLSRCSSTEPPPTTNSLALIKEEPDGDKSASFPASPIKTFAEPGFLEGEQVDQQEAGGGERTRRDSTGSVGGFAAIAGVQKMCEGEDGGEVFSPPHTASPSPSPVQEATTHSPVLLPTDTAAVPGRCPYCPHISQKFEGVAMMRHLLVSHPCKPAFPCDTCWRVFVKRVGFKAHQQICQQSSGS